VTGAALPDPGSPDFPAIMAVALAALWSAVAFARRLPREEVQWQGFVAGTCGALFGLLAYLVDLITNLY
jgi:hypothetical protein